MKNYLLSISVPFLLFPFSNAGSLPETPMAVNTGLSSGDDKSAENLYGEIGLADYGLSLKAFRFAWAGFKHLASKNILHNKSLLTICDLSQASSRKRLYIIDIDEHKLLLNTMVAHGKNSGNQVATRFSNRMNSHQTSLGFYITENIYTGENGVSLRLKGIERGFNDLAEKRNIVIHGADYIDEEKHSTGRSFGCPAVPQEKISEIIELIKGGTCLFIYYPAKNYLQHSKILND